jgi:hypothetical protein
MVSVSFKDATWSHKLGLLVLALLMSLFCIAIIGAVRSTALDIMGCTQLTISRYCDWVNDLPQSIQKLYRIALEGFRSTGVSPDIVTGTAKSWHNNTISLNLENHLAAGNLP